MLDGKPFDAVSSPIHELCIYDTLSAKSLYHPSTTSESVSSHRAVNCATKTPENDKMDDAVRNTVSQLIHHTHRHDISIKYTVLLDLC